MANVAIDFLDGSDVDEDNVDQEVENVLLGSDDEEATPQHFSRPRAAVFSGAKYGGGSSRNNVEEEEDVLNLDLEGEPLDYEGDAQEDDNPNFRVSVSESQRGDGNEPSDPNFEDNVELNEGFRGRFVEEDDYDDADDDEEENRNTRSRFTTERKVDPFSNSSGGHGSHSVGIPIQTVGDRKIRPNAVDGRPKHWNQNGPPRHGGPRFQGRNPRFQNPRPGLNEMNTRGHMGHPVVQFNEGLFTDFNQPLRHPRMRPPMPGASRFDGPRNVEGGPHRHPMAPRQDQPNMRPNFPPNNNRPFFPQNENRFGPPRPPPPPGTMGYPQHPCQPRPEFHMRGPRVATRFPPNSPGIPNQRGYRPPPPPPGIGNPPPHLQEGPPPFAGRPQNPYPPMPRERPPNAHGFPHPINGPPGFMPHHPANMHHPQRFMGPPRQPADGPANAFYMQEQPTSLGHSFHPGPTPEPYPEPHWSGQPPPDVPVSVQGPSWMHPQHHYGGQAFPPNSMIDHTVHPPNAAIIHPGSHYQHQPMPLTIQSSHHLEIPITSKSIYIKPNSEIHEALSKGQLRHHLKEDDRRHHESSSSSKYYDQYRERDRERDNRDRSSHRHESSSSDRRRDDDYYDDRKSYHHEYDRKTRRKYDDDRSDRDRRHRSGSPEMKISRLERSTDDRTREKQSENKESEKLLEEAKKMGLGEDYVKKLEEQRKLREKLLKIKEQRRKQVVTGSATDSKSADSNLKEPNPSGSRSSEGGKGIEADSTVASGKNSKRKKVLRIVRDKSGNIISKKVHYVLVAKQQQEGQQSTSTS